MLSYNSNYEESGEFVQYGPSKVGLTDCGLQCKVACGCNNEKGWYLAVPDGNYDTKKSARTYDYIIDDDGKLASSGTTLSSAGRTLSGSTKSLSAGGSTITCTKQTCPDGYTATKPLSYFDYVTVTLRHGDICYKVTGCASGYAPDGTGTGGISHNNMPCYKIQYYTVTIEASLDDLNHCPSSLTSKVGSTVSSCSLDGSSCTPSLGSSTTKTIRRVRGKDSYSISLGQDGCYTMGSDGINDWYLYSNGIMKNGNYMSTDVGAYGPSASDTITGDTTYSLMFNCGKGQCPEDCEYTTTASDCSNACKSLSDNSCVINGTTYYKECGSSKCYSDETCNGSGTCVCDYTTSKATCDAQCQYTGTRCTRDTYKDYYNGCGASKCSSGQICLSGTCHTHDWYCTDSTYSYETESSAAPHASSAQKEQKCSTCGATRTGTCYAKGSHNYSWCDTSNGYSLTECNSCQEEVDSKDVECTKCSSTSTSDTCYKCKYISHAAACGTNYTSEPDGKECTAYIPPCSNGNTYTCYKDCKDKVQYYTVTISKAFEGTCPSNYADAYNGINGGCKVGDQNCSTHLNYITIRNVPAGSVFSVNEPSCYGGGSIARAYFYSCDGCSSTASSGGSGYDLTATINSDTDITFTYNCDNGSCGGPDPDTTCVYTYTEQDCSNACKYVGSKSCSRNDIVYYETCGSSKCSSGQTCSNGSCQNSTSCPSGYYSSKPNSTYFTYATSNGCYKVTDCKSPYTKVNDSISVFVAEYEPQTFNCFERKCSDFSFYDGTQCSEFPTSASGSACARSYMDMGSECQALGSKPGEVNNRCNVDSWNRCCLYCNGRGT